VDPALITGQAKSQTGKSRKEIKHWWGLKGRLKPWVGENPLKGGGQATKWSLWGGPANTQPWFKGEKGMGGQEGGGGEKSWFLKK